MKVLLCILGKQQVLLYIEFNITVEVCKVQFICAFLFAFLASSFREAFEQVRTRSICNQSFFIIYEKALYFLNKYYLPDNVCLIISIVVKLILNMLLTIQIY